MRTTSAPAPKVLSFGRTLTMVGTGKTWALGANRIANLAPRNWDDSTTLTTGEVVLIGGARYEVDFDPFGPWDAPIRFKEPSLK